MKDFWTINPFYFEKVEGEEEIKFFTALKNNNGLSLQNLVLNDQEFKPEEFKQIGLLVDVFFQSSGWYCGSVSAVCRSRTLIYVDYENKDPSTRLMPKKGEIRKCFHRPQVTYATK